MHDEFVRDIDFADDEFALDLDDGDEYEPRRSTPHEDDDVDYEQREQLARYKRAHQRAEEPLRRSPSRVRAGPAPRRVAAARSLADESMYFECNRLQIIRAKTHYEDKKPESHENGTEQNMM